MPFYKDSKNKTHFLESAEFEYILPPGSVRITEQEADMIANPPATMIELIAKQIHDINAAYELAIQQIKSGYPPSEIESWYKQEAQARAFQADANATTLWLDNAATTRGLDKTEFASRIITKAEQFEVISGELTGKRQALEDQLNALQAQLDDPQQADPIAADIEAVVW